jgi:hypothetical protein
MHDALNAIIPAYETYAFNGNDHATHPIAAMASAAYTVLVNSLPHPKAMLATRLTQSLADIKEGEGKTKEIALGKKRLKLYWT